MAFVLSDNSYGKSKVRLTKVVRKGAVHELFEIDAAIQLTGDFDAAYYDGDNTQVVATDSIKNTVYVLAKENDFKSIEQFAMILAKHFVKTYEQVHSATVELTQTAWQRITVGGKPHDHAFTSAGPQLRYAGAIVETIGEETETAATLGGGVRNLLVLKTTGSEWRDFVSDRYRTLKDTRDRIIATRVDADWTYNTTDADFDKANAAITDAILTTFATQHSLGVQQTLQAMGEAALKASPTIDAIQIVRISVS